MQIGAVCALSVSGFTAILRDFSEKAEVFLWPFLKKIHICSTRNFITHV